MAIQISPKAHAAIEELVASGRYADAETAVEAAISRLAAEERKLVWLEEQLAEARAEDEAGQLIDFTAELAERRIQDAIQRFQARRHGQNGTGS
jgi:Arc/MetJ-type ribon-helix-helix transcriptional regulator